MENVILEVKPEALKEAALLAKERKTGARGLRSIIEKALMAAMYEVPDNNKQVKKVVVTAETIRNGKAEYEEFSDSEPNSRISSDS